MICAETLQEGRSEAQTLLLTYLKRPPCFPLVGVSHQVSLPALEESVPGAPVCVLNLVHPV